jgi:hypothetical protein
VEVREGEGSTTETLHNRAVPLMAAKQRDHSTLFLRLVTALVRKESLEVLEFSEFIKIVLKNRYHSECKSEGMNLVVGYLLYECIDGLADFPHFCSR